MSAGSAATSIAAAFHPLVGPVAFGAQGTGMDGGALDAARAVDSNGYASVPPLMSATLSAHAVGGAADAVVATGVSGAAGSLLTFVLLDGAGLGGARLLECIDNAGSLGLFSACTMRGGETPERVLPPSSSRRE